jgi:hypothetical protein
VKSQLTEDFIVCFRELPEEVKEQARKSYSSKPNFRIFAVGSGGNLTLQNTTVSGGVASGESFPNYAGGGVLNSGTTTLTSSTVSGNSAFFGGGVLNNSGTMTQSHTLISGNTGGSSPEVYNNFGTINVNDFNLLGFNGSFRD